MSNSRASHVRVLLRKDFITLRRTSLLSMIILPILVMSGFAILADFFVPTLSEEQHNFTWTKYTQFQPSKGPFLMSNMTKRAANDDRAYNATNLGACRRLDRPYVGVVAPPNLVKPLEQAFKSSGRGMAGKSMIVRPYNSTEAFLEQVRTNISNEFCFGFEVTDMYPGVEEVNVTIMYPLDVASNTFEPLFDETTSVPNMRSWNMTFLYGTPQFFSYITDLLTFVTTGHRPQDVELLFMPMKTPEFHSMDPVASKQLTMVFPFFFMCIYLLPLYYMVTKLSEERESKAREGMKMMGLNDGSYFTSWWIFLLLIISMMSGLTVLTSSFNVLVNSDKLRVLAFCILYGMTFYGFAFAVVAFLPNRKTSATAASIAHLLSYYVAFMYQGYSATNRSKLIAALIPNCAMSFMVNHLFQLEFNGQGLNSDNASTQIENFSFNQGLMMLALDAILFALIGMYLDQVVPREIGLSKPWNFLCASKKRVSFTKSKLGEEQHMPDLIRKQNFEAVPAHLQRDDGQCFKVRGLTKVFGNGKRAVDGTSLTMYNGQIFALLGHNGAGKTTTISMLTGLLEPTEGRAEVFGFDAFEDMSRLRENLGVCPQHNVLFDYLTVNEHLRLYASFKGVAEDVQQERIDRMIYDMELTSVQDQLASTLSGGQKRKLSVGIALIGDSKIVMLDEPTSGMDTTTRRKFWEMLKQYKEGRIVILTTHYMDEADMLGDRICIMAEGKIQCCGSSLFLKRRFGAGYNLVIAKNSRSKPTEVEKFIKGKLPEARKLQDVSSEVTYQLPVSVSSKFKDFFNSLDRNMEGLGLNSYGVTITTLEDVFLKIGHGEDAGTTIDTIKSQTADLSKLSQRDQELTLYSIADEHHRSFCRQLLALIKKRYLVITRARKTFLADFLLPAILVAIGLYLSSIDLLTQNYPARHLTVDAYPTERPLIFNINNFNQTDGQIQDFVEQNFAADIGPGKLFKELVPVKTNISSHLFEQAAEIDDVIFDMRHDTPSYGQFFFQQVNTEDRYYAMGAFINATQPNAALAYAGYLAQSVLRQETGNPNFKLNFYEKPLPFSLRFLNYLGAATGVIVVASLSIAYMMASDSVVQGILREKQNMVKHQIMLSGGSKISYWLANYIVDVMFHSVPAIVSIFMISYLELDVPEGWRLFIHFTFINPLCIYAMSFFFSDTGKASVVIRVFYFFFGAVCPVAVQILRVVNRECIEIAAKWSPYFVYIPIYDLNMGYLSILNRETIELLMKLPKDSLVMDPMAWEIGGEPIYMLRCSAGACLSVIILCELGTYEKCIRPWAWPLYLFVKYSCVQLRRKKKARYYSVRKAYQYEPIDVEQFRTIAEDEDPRTEEKRVLRSAPENFSIRISRLAKSYDLKQKAVSDLSFGLESGECFALLGVTGAGKTTTFKCLTGEEIADEGYLHMGGHDVKSKIGFEKARCLMGYCPQFDALIEGMTVREHLELFAEIRGLPQDMSKELVDKQIKELDLLEYDGAEAQNLSGGNKRKLQCAIALIGNPPIVLLDEPSTGVDPQARRFMWTIISNISTMRKKSTVILTTHSMEEAEALCTKMGIMVEGEFKCFGSSQHIKDKYGEGFDIEFKIKTLSETEVTELMKKRGITWNKVSRKDIGALFKQAGYGVDLANEICQGGLGDDLHSVLQRQDKLLVPSVLKWAHIEKNGAELLKKLGETFKDCSLLEHYNNSYSVKVSRDNFSIGYVFGLIEDLKQKYSIQEYSASQTSLEQIFNMFAREAKFKKSKSALAKKRD